MLKRQSLCKKTRDRQTEKYVLVMEEHWQNCQHYVLVVDVQETRSPNDLQKLVLMMMMCRCRLDWSEDAVELRG